MKVISSLTILVIFATLACSFATLFANAASVNYLQCRDCVANASQSVVNQSSCANLTFAENTLQQIPGFTDRWMSVSCNTSTNLMCAQLYLSTEGQTCSVFHNTASFQCGGCNKFGDLYYKMNCPRNVSNNVNVSWTVCSDSACSVGCTPPDTIYNLDDCVPLFRSPTLNVEIYAKLTEIVPCAVVAVSVYNANSATAANLVENEFVGQDRCNNYGRFSCSNEPNLPNIVTGHQVLISDFGHQGSCSGTVNYATVGSGTCRWRSNSIGEIVTCDSSNQQCANLLTVGNFQGRIFSNSFNPQCNSCQHFPDFHGGASLNSGSNIWTWVGCDAAQTVTFNHGCPAGCAPGSCVGITTTHPFDITSTTPFNGMNLLNLGVFKCNVIRRQAFNSSICDSSDPANVIEDLYLAEGRCSMGHLAECGVFAEQEAIIGECLLMTPETRQDVTSGDCDIVNGNFYGGSNFTAKATCLGENSNCAVIHFWNTNSNETAVIDQRTFVCNTCYYDHRWAVNGQTGPFFVHCINATTIILIPSIDPTITNCPSSNLNGTGASYYNLFQPTLMATNLGVNYNPALVPHLMLAGLTRCFAAHLDVWNNTNSAQCKQFNYANNQYIFGGSLGEAGCDITCSDPIRPTYDPESNYDVLVHMCHPPSTWSWNATDSHHTHFHPVCETHRHAAGICDPLDMEHQMMGPQNMGDVWTVKATCGEQARCAQILIFNESTNHNNCSFYTSNASGNFMQRFHSRWNAVCDQCLFDSMHGWSYVACDFFSNSITLLTNCSANCNNWRSHGSCQNRLQIGYQGCYSNGNQWAFRSLGVEACNVVHAQYWNNSACVGTPVWDIVAQEDTASGPGGATFDCIPRDTNYYLPGGNFTYIPCSRTDQTIRSNQQQAACINNLHTPGTSSMVTCHADKPDQCVSFTLFNSATCTQSWAGLINAPCNSCFKAPDGTYAFAQCFSSGARPDNQNRYAWNPAAKEPLVVTLKTGCNVGCSVCQTTIASDAISQCTSWNSASGNIWGQIAGIRPCVTASYMEWPAADCQGTPSTITYVQQDVCTKDIGLISCQVQPPLMPKPTGPTVSVRLTECSTGGCNGICTIHSVGSGSCIPLADTVGGGGSAMLTCSGQTGTCAHLMFFNGGQWQGKFAQVCNSCNQFPGHGAVGSNYMHVACFPNGTVQRSINCDSTCSNCQSVLDTDPLLTLQNLPPPPGQTTSNAQILNIGLFPCNILQRSVFQDDNCSGSVIATGPLAEDTCNNGVTLSCGYYDEESLVLTNCSNPTQPAQVIMSTQCTPWFGIQSKFTCQHGLSVCANLAVNMNGGAVSPTTCTHEMMYSAKCGSCLTLTNADGSAVPVRINCDFDKSTMTLQKCDDIRCSSCDPTAVSQTFTEGACTLQSANNNKIPVSGSFWGFAPCTIVKEEFFMNKSNSATDQCDGDELFSEVYSSQGTCNGNHRIQCGSFVEGVANGPINMNGALTALSIFDCGSDMTCASNCRKKMTVATSKCVPTPTYPSTMSTRQPPGSQSSIYACPVASACAHLVIFNRLDPNYVNGTCRRTAAYAGHDFNVACNTCHYTPFGGMIRVDCDLVRETLTVLHGCDATCSNCNYTAAVVQRGFENCTLGADISQPMDVVNVGTYTCGIVTARGFSDSACTTLAHTIGFPSSTCQFGSVATCEVTYDPNANTNAAPSSGGGNIGGAVAGAIIGVVAVIALVVLYFKLKARSNNSSSSQYHEEPMHAQYQAFMAGEESQKV